MDWKISKGDIKGYDWAKKGRYRLIELMGTGGNANVYRALDNHENEFAVKILKVGSYPTFQKSINALKMK